MDDAAPGRGGWKARIGEELIEYSINVVYLAIVFAAFTNYRRLILASYGIVYTDYWVAVIEALILGKVIMIASVLRIGRRLERAPLIFSTLYKTTAFTVFVAVFKLAEHTVRALWHGEGIAGGLIVVAERGLPVVLANSLVILVAFIPFFAVKELARVMGRGRIAALFFRKPASPPVP